MSPRPSPSHSSSAKRLQNAKPASLPAGRGAGTPRRGVRDLSYRDRPFWRAVDPGSELQYLGWGQRRYDQSPTTPSGYYPDSSMKGLAWSYTIILRGTPTILLSDGQHILAPDHALLIHYNDASPIGLTDAPGRTAEVLNWIWRTPPAIEVMRPGANGYILTRLTPATRRRLVAIHRACRGEVVRPDAFTLVKLSALRCEIDVELARCLQAGQPGTDRELMLENAVRWIEKNLHRPNPVARLCDYLQIARSTLSHLFIEKLGESPSAYHHRLRMAAGKRMLDEEKLPAKVAALNLGYKHPSDFSRAFKGFFGVSPGGKGRSVTP
jgi:AraC-like DNA-binding protein